MIFKRERERERERERLTKITNSEGDSKHSWPGKSWVTD